MLLRGNVGARKIIRNGLSPSSQALKKSSVQIWPAVCSGRSEIRPVCSLTSLVWLFLSGAESVVSCVATTMSQRS